MRKIGIAVLTTAWWIVNQTTQTQFTSSHRPYQPRVPRSIQAGSKNDFTARPSSMMPYAAPRSRMLGHPVFQRTAVSRITRTPAPYNQIKRRAAIGFSHSRGGVDPESISAMTGERRTSARRGRRFGWAPGSFMGERVVRLGHKRRGNNVAGHHVPPDPPAWGGAGGTNNGDPREFPGLQAMTRPLTPVRAAVVFDADRCAGTGCIGGSP